MSLLLAIGYKRGRRCRSLHDALRISSQRVFFFVVDATIIFVHVQRVDVDETVARAHSGGGRRNDE